MGLNKFFLKRAHRVDRKKKPSFSKNKELNIQKSLEKEQMIFHSLCKNHITLEVLIVLEYYGLIFTI